MRAVWSALIVAALAGGAAAQVTEFTVEGDSIPKSLTGKPGVAARGKALLMKREAANCLECHSISDKALGAGGTKGPSLDGVGALLTQGQLRMSVVDISQVVPKTIMPSFHADEAFRPKQGSKPRLTAEEVEDVVAYLGTLRRR